MCGIFGFSTDPEVELSRGDIFKRTQIVSGLSLSMQSRGALSTGICGYNKEDNAFRTDKKPVSAAQFIEDKKIIEILNKSLTLIGHTRNPSRGVGGVTAENSHPFRKGNIIGCHNGSVFNWQDINDKVNVDSEVIFELLNKYDNDVVKAMKEIRGPAALTWYNLKKPKNIYMLAHEKPFHVVWSDYLKTLFWASLPEPLEIMLQLITRERKVSEKLVEDTAVSCTGTNLSKIGKVEFNKWVAPVSKGKFSSDYMGQKKWQWDDSKKTSVLVNAQPVKNINSDFCYGLPGSMLIFLVENKSCFLCFSKVKPDKSFCLDPLNREVICNHCCEMVHEPEKIGWTLVSPQDYGTIRAVYGKP